MAVDGQLDLAHWSFEEGGDLELSGTWEICWGQLLEPGEACPSAWRPVPVRGVWTEASSGSPFGGKGVATYRLRITLPEGERRLSLVAGGAYSAQRLFIDGVDRGGAGVVGRSAADTRMGVRNRVYDLPVGSRDTELVVQVANFEFRSGGLRRIWFIGLHDSIQRGIGHAMLREGMLFSVGVLIGLGYLALFALGRSEQARGYFGLTALVLGLRAVPASLSGFGELLAPWAGFALLTRLEYLGTAIVLFAAAGYVRTKVPGVAPPRMLKGVQLAALALAAITAFAPFELILATLPVQYVLPVIVLLACIGSYGRAWIRGVPGVRVTAAAATLYFLVVVHDIARTVWTGVGAPVELYPYAMVIWILAEAWELMQRFYVAFTRVESLSDALGEANFELQENESAIVRFVPFDLLRLLGKQSIREVDAGDRVRAHMSVLRCGVRPPPDGSASAAPEHGFELVSRLVERVERLVEHRGGFVNEFGGDGFEALFSGRPDDAVAAAREIVEAVCDGGGRASGDLAIGIDTGAVVMGTAGGHQRLMRGVFGEPIETARALEREASRAGIRILISGATRAGLSEADGLETRRIDGAAEAFEVVVSGSSRKPEAP